MITIERNEHSGLMPKTHHLYAEASEMVRIIYNEFQRIEEEHNYTVTIGSKCKVSTECDSKYRPYDVSIFLSKGNGHHLSCLEWLFNKPKSTAYPISRKMATYLHKNCRHGGIYGLLRHLPFIEEVLQADIDNTTVVEPIIQPVAPIVAVATKEAVVDNSTVYNLYKALRERLNTRHESTTIIMNETVQVTALVMFLEDWNPELEARFEAERSPKPVAPAPTITKAATKYDRKQIAELAHQHAKALGDGEYRTRFGEGMRKAWKAAKEAVATNATYKSVYLYTNYIMVDDMRIVQKMFNTTSAANSNYTNFQSKT